MTCDERIEAIAEAMEKIRPGAGAEYRKLADEFCGTCVDQLREK